jgi:hypothetical protein
MNLLKVTGVDIIRDGNGAGVLSPASLPLPPALGGEFVSSHPHPHEPLQVPTPPLPPPLWVTLNPSSFLHQSQTTQKTSNNSSQTPVITETHLQSAAHISQKRIPIA